MFNQQEIQILLGGVNSPIDWDDLRTNTNYGGLYDDKEETITAFWNVCFISPFSLVFWLSGRTKSRGVCAVKRCFARFFLSFSD